MKAKPYFFTYLFSLAIGVLLFIFTGRTNLFYWMVVAIGALFILPSAGAIIDALIPKRGPTGRKAQTVVSDHTRSGRAGVRCDSHLSAGILRLVHRLYARRGAYPFRTGAARVTSRVGIRVRNQPMVLRDALADTDSLA